MPLPNNILQNVRTYNKADLAFLLNNNAFIATANTKYKNFPLDFRINALFF